MQLALAEESIPDYPADIAAAFEAHHGMVFRTAYRLTGNAADAEDVMQTVFLRLLGRGAGAGAVEKPESYLRRAAINVSVDLLRERQRGPLAAPDADAAAGGADPELREALRRALARLEPKHAAMFALRFFEGCSYAEIAGTLGLSRVVVAVTLHRLRQKLRRELQQSVRQG